MLNKNVDEKDFWWKKFDCNLKLETKFWLKSCLRKKFLKLNMFGKQKVCKKIRMTFVWGWKRLFGEKISLCPLGMGT